MNDLTGSTRFDTLNLMTSKRRNSAIALLMELSLGASACAGETTVTTPAAETPTTETPTTGAAPDTEPPASEAAETTVSETDEPTTTLSATPAVAFDLLDFDLTEITTGNTVNLTNVADGKPLVLWFFAPH
jgi:hypothetical protein